LDSNQDLSTLKVNGIIFYSIIYIGDMCISSGSDGYLYIWKEGRLAIRQNAHPGTAVLSLYTTPNSHIFASGGANGRVVIWK
jgi:WD40 repeat protein